MERIDTNSFHLLDHGHLRLVSYTQPVPGMVVPEWSGDLEAVRNARVSYAADWRAGEDAGKDAKLLKRLVEHNHTTPLEAVVFTFDIKCPIFIARQWHRHRTWSYNEVSARYTELPEEFYVPELDIIGKQHSTDKQMREIGEFNEEHGFFAEAIEQHSELCFKRYKIALEKGIPRELARMFLPLNTYTHFFGTVDLHNLFHFIKLRLDPHAQYEIQVYAHALLKLAETVCPVLVKEFAEKNNFVAYIED